MVNPKTMDEMGFFKGDTVYVNNAASGSQTISVILNDINIDNNIILMNKVNRKNIGVNIGDTVKLTPAQDIPYLSSIRVVCL